MDMISLCITFLSWTISSGMALQLFYRGFIFYPILVCVSNCIGQYMASVIGTIALSMVPISSASIPCFIAEPCLGTAATLLYCGLFWAAAYKFMWGMFTWGYRKDTSHLTMLYRKKMYERFDYFGRATVSPPPKSMGKPEPGFVFVARTCCNNGERLHVHGPLKLERGQPNQGEVTIILDPDVRYQTCVGFGGAFTETSADLLLQMSSANQERIMDAYFRDGLGIGYSVGRLHMNSCDFSRGDWSCTEGTDKELKTFSLKNYEKAILPMVKRAVKAAGRPLTLFASPWSPPGWMKDTGKMLDGGKLLPEFRQAWAKYYVLFAQKLKEAGFPLWGFTVQNEPDAKNGWENCIFSAEEERDFIRDHLGPAVAGSGMDLKILAWDHNRDDLFRRAITIEKDAEAAKYVYGYGWHWYGDARYDWWADANDHAVFENVKLVHELCPKKGLWVTEVCQENGAHMGDWAVAERYAETIIRDFNNWCEAFVDWNLILDHEGGPNHRGNQCSAPVIVDIAKDRVLFQPSFFYIGHFARHIQPGAVRILSSASRNSMQVLAFANPDGTIALNILNQTDNGTIFCVSFAGRLVRWFCEPRSLTTLLIHPDEPISQAKHMEVEKKAAAEGDAAGREGGQGDAQAKPMELDNEAS